MRIVHQSNRSNVVAYHTHQGFGDLISCSPIVNSLSRNNPDKKFLLVTRAESYARNLRRFCVPEVEVVVINEYPSHKDAIPQHEVMLVNAWAEHYGFSIVRSGFDRYHYDPSLPWDFAFYENAGVPYDDKTNHFVILRDKQREKEVIDKSGAPAEGGYAFVHDDPSRGLRFSARTSLPAVRNVEDADIADMAGVLESATELHLMGSSLLCLADLMQLPRDKQSLYYYTFRGELNVRGSERWIKVLSG